VKFRHKARASSSRRSPVISVRTRSLKLGSKPFGLRQIGNIFDSSGISSAKDEPNPRSVAGRLGLRAFAGRFGQPPDRQ
jgi:hypothetical protein